MLVLDTTSKTITVAMSGAAATTNPSFVTAYSDDNGTTFVEGSSDGILNGTTQVTMVAAPAASTRRLIKSLFIENNDTAPVTIIVTLNNSGTLRNIQKVTLAVGDNWSTDGVIDSNGNFKQLGASGYSGYSGFSGFSGISGFSGTNGASGFSGISGYSGFSGSGVSGYSGFSGAAGPTVYPGAGIAVSTGSGWGTSLSDPLTGTHGGTGVNNGSNTITIAGNLTHAGAFTQSFTATANTAVTLPAGATASSNNLLSSATAVGIVTGTPSSTTYLRGDGTWATVSASGGSSISNGTSNVTVNSSGGTVTIATAGTTAVTVDTSQNVGIGTSSPSEKLHIYGANPYLLLQGSEASAQTLYMRESAGGLYFGQYGVGTRMLLDSSGNLLVGGTTAGAKVRIEASLASQDGLDIKNTSATTGQTFVAFFNSANGIAGTITQPTSTTVLYNTTSDYRLKTVLGAVTGHGERIDALKPVDFLWKDGGQQARGFLAHEFQEVYVNSVTGTKDAVDTDGNPKYQAMQSGSAEVNADLVAEIQSLRKRLTALENK